MSKKSKAVLPATRKYLVFGIWKENSGLSAEIENVFSIRGVEPRLNR
jgi:hypothetical protein